MRTSAARVSGCSFFLQFPLFREIKRTSSGIGKLVCVLNGVNNDTTACELNVVASSACDLMDTEEAPTREPPPPI